MVTLAGKGLGHGRDLAWIFNVNQVTGMYRYLKSGKVVEEISFF